MDMIQNNEIYIPVEDASASGNIPTLSHGRMGVSFGNILSSRSGRLLVALMGVNIVCFSIQVVGISVLFEAFGRFHGDDMMLGFMRPRVSERGTNNE